MVKHKAMDDWAVTFVAPQATQASTSRVPQSFGAGRLAADVLIRRPGLGPLLPAARRLEADDALGAAVQRPCETWNFQLRPGPG